MANAIPVHSKAKVEAPKAEAPKAEDGVKGVEKDPRGTPLETHSAFRQDH